MDPQAEPVSFFCGVFCMIIGFILFFVPLILVDGVIVGHSPSSWLPLALALWLTIQLLNSNFNSGLSYARRVEAGGFPALTCLIFQSSHDHLFKNLRYTDSSLPCFPVLLYNQVDFQPYFYNSCEVPNELLFIPFLGNKMLHKLLAPLKEESNA